LRRPLIPFPAPSLAPRESYHIGRGGVKGAAGLLLGERGDAGEDLAFDQFERGPAAGRDVGQLIGDSRGVDRGDGVPAGDGKRRAGIRETLALDEEAGEVIAKPDGVRNRTDSRKRTLFERFRTTT